MDYVIGILIGLILGAGGIFAYFHFAAQSAVARARHEADRLREDTLRDAQIKAKEIELAAQQEQLKAKSLYERENEVSRRKLEEHESRLSKREDVLDRKLDTLGVKEKHLDDMENKLARRDKSLIAKEGEMDQVLKDQRDRLLQISGMNFEQAKELMLRRLEDECRAEAGE